MADISEEKLAVMAEKKRKYALENNITPPRITKISDDQIHEVMSLLESGKSCIEVAKVFNVNRSTIYDIKNRRSAII